MMVLGQRTEEGNARLSAFEKHYSVKEIAKMWGYSRETIRQIFVNEKGVLRIGRPETRFKRKYWRISIPESVLVRVYKQRSN